MKPKSVKTITEVYKKREFNQMSRIGVITTPILTEVCYLSQDKIITKVKLSADKNSDRKINYCFSIPHRSNVKIGSHVILLPKNEHENPRPLLNSTYKSYGLNDNDVAVYVDLKNSSIYEVPENITPRTYCRPLDLWMDINTFKIIKVLEMTEEKYESVLFRKNRCLIKETDKEKLFSLYEESILKDYVLIN